MIDPIRQHRNLFMEKNDDFKIIRYTSKDCPEKVLRATAYFYIYIFNNASDHFFVHRKTKNYLGRSDIPELQDHDAGYVTNDVLNKLYTEKYKDKGYAFWHEPEQTFENIKRKLSSDGQLVLLINEKLNNRIYGFSFGRKCTAIEALNDEEWIDPYIYSNLSQEERITRDKTHFLEKINDFLAVHKSKAYRYKSIEVDTPVYCWNAAGIAPELQGNGYVRRINDLFFRSIPEEWGNLLQLGEASDKKEGPTYENRPTNLDKFQSIGAEKIMKMGEDLYLIGAPVKSFVQGLIKQ